MRTTATRTMELMSCAGLIGVALAQSANAQSITPVLDNRNGTITATDNVGPPQTASYTVTPANLYGVVGFDQCVNDNGRSACLNHVSYFLYDIDNHVKGFTAQGALSVSKPAGPGSTASTDHVQVAFQVEYLEPGLFAPFQLTASIQRDYGDATIHVTGPGVDVSLNNDPAWNGQLFLTNGVYTISVDANATYANPNADGEFVDYAITLYRSFPTNDACTQAIPVTVGSTGVFNFNASGSTSVPIGCGLGGATTIFNDVFYTYVAPTAGITTVSVCNATYNSVLAAFTGSCDAPVWVTCNDNSVACQGLSSEITFDATCGQTYTIVLGAAGQSFQGVATMVITQQGVANDECSGALPVRVGENAVSNDCATSAITLPPSCDEGYGLAIYKDVYYTYVAEGTGPVTVSTCGAATFDTRLGVFAGSCASPVWLGCNDDSPGCAGFTSRLTFDAVCGQSYTIVLGSYDGQSGSATMTITQEGYCNDTCDNAAPVFVGPNFVSNIGATGLLQGLPGSCDQGFGLNFFNDVFYRYVATGTGTITVSTCGSLGFDSRLAAFTGPCDAPFWVGCDDDGCGVSSGPSTMTFQTTCGEVYTIVLGSYDGSSGSGTMTITQIGTCPPPCPADLNGNRSVGADDLAVLLGQWNGPGSADLDGNGVVSSSDLAILLGAWGPCP